MPSILNEIGFFQFDNLIRNRVPFILVNMGVDLKGFYSQTVYQAHLESMQVLTSYEDAATEVKKLGRPQHEAVVILCADGQSSLHLVDQLETAGFTNVFYVKGGLQALKTDASR